MALPFRFFRLLAQCMKPGCAPRAAVVQPHVDIIADTVGREKAIDRARTDQLAGDDRLQ